MAVERSHRDLWHALALVALKLVVSAVVLRAGFSAISDDDYARVVIAQEFAEAPKVDPSGTSWLPLPFFVTGVPMLLLGSTLEVARLVALILGAGAVVVVWWAARLLGATPRGALLGGAVAALFPYSAWLGAAMVPELPTAACTVLALACAVASRPGATTTTLPLPGAGVALVGALAISAACASRYEPWPIAAGLAALYVLDARHAAPAERRLRLAAAGLAVSFPLAWFAHGQYHYADPLFFVKRVAEYKAALGADSSLLATLLGYPLALLRNEPELCTAVLLVVALGGPRLPWRRPLLLLALQLVTLIVGDVRGGAPTHHAERALVSWWLLGCLFLGQGLVDAALRRSAQGGWRLTRVGWAAVAAPLLGLVLYRPFWTRVGQFAPRSAELQLGALAHARLAPEQHLVIQTPDYGYFAVIAAFGHPARAVVTDDHDPRRGAPRPTDAGHALRQSLLESGTRWAIVHRDALLQLPGARLRAHAGELRLVEWDPGNSAQYARLP